MPRFILIDHSLTTLGGHHYEYAAQILGAAEHEGYELHLACGRELTDFSGMPAGCRNFPVFRYPSYGRCSELYDRRVRLRDRDRRERRWRANPWLAALRGATDCRHLFQQAKLLFRRPRWRDSFARSCEEFFARVELNDGDHVFLPTVSEFDLTCLIAYLSRAPQHARRAIWHLQFHLNYLDGRELNIDDHRARVEYMRNCFLAAQQLSGEFRLRFYTTTEGLRRQYEQLQVAPFTALPYPANATLAAADLEPPPKTSRTATARSTISETRRPLRLVCAGRPRAEKGSHLLQATVNELWDEFFAPGRLQLHVQSEAGVSPVTAPRRAPAGCEPIVATPYPLSVDDYAALIRSADIGLFLYDSEEYAVRCSGVLVEMLAAGTPVVVPGACWLGDQIAEVNACRLDHLAAACGEPAIIARPGDSQIQIRTSLDRGDLLLSCRQPPQPAGPVAVETIQRGRANKIVHRGRVVLSPREANKKNPPRAMIHLAAGCERIEVRWEQAFGGGAYRGGWDARLLPGERHSGGGRAGGAVGLEAPDPDQIPDLLRDIVRHWDDYRRRALVRSADWRDRHHPMRTLELLTDLAPTAEGEKLSRAA